METCNFCGTKGIVEQGPFSIFQPDKDRGFWCENCDGYTPLEDKNRNRFKLFLEDETLGSPINNTTKTKLSKRLSPFRYPGGKTRIVNFLYNETKDLKTGKLISPFTGGGSFELSMLEAGIVDELHLNDLDFGIYSVYWVIKHIPGDLVLRLETENPTHSDFFRAQESIKKGYSGLTILESAWAALLVNRLAYSGIYKANPMGGRNGSREKLLARWNPKELIRRIEKIHSFSDKYTVTNKDAVQLIEESFWDEGATIFIDPPYLLKGKDLYNKYYEEDDHLILANLLDSLHQGTPGADIVVTYDYHEHIKNIFKHPDKEIINRKYSI